MSIGLDDSEYAGTPTMLETNTLTDSVLILLSLTVVQRLVGFVRAVLFCRWLDPEQLGLWDMALSFLLLAAPLSVLSIPGAFGRYLEHYRQQGQFRTFLRRMIAGCSGLMVVAIGLLLLFRDDIAHLVFGSPDEAGLVVLAACCLSTVIVYNFLIELFTALRNVRTASTMQFLNGVAFAVFGVFLLVSWDCSARSVLLSYGASCLVAILWAGRPLCRAWQASPCASEPIPHSAIWGKMLPFAGWILLGNAITNIFGVLDRYMIMHFSNIPPANVLDVIGNYHSSRVVPVLLISIATMLGAMILPHLTHDWEAGRRAEVASRLQLCVKLIGFGMFAVAVMVLIGSPLLFDLAYRGKFPGGEAVFPLALVYSTWFGLIFILHDYLLCAEHARLTSAALFVGLLVNIGLNLLLLPRFGLDGAVLATAAANGVSLLLICVFNYRLGFRIDDGTQLVLVLPVFLCAGPWVAGLSVVLTLLLAIGGNRLLSPEEKRQIAASLNDYKERSGLNRWLARPSRQ